MKTLDVMIILRDADNRIVGSYDCDARNLSEAFEFASQVREGAHSCTVWEFDEDVENFPFYWQGKLIGVVIYA